MNISVCMAVHNGANFIREQIASILPQLGENDELVIVDDASVDDSVMIIESFSDQRIRVVRQNCNCGVVQTFGRALGEATGEIVFLCDQDDVWRAGKVQKFKDLFSRHSEVSLAVSDASIIDMEGNITTHSFFTSRQFHTSLLLNLIRNCFLGCTMVFRRSLLMYCLPIPDDIPMHDMWIGMVNQLVGKTVFIAEPLMFYRRHNSNATAVGHASFLQMVRWRYALAKNLALLYLRKVAMKRSALCIFSHQIRPQ